MKTTKGRGGPRPGAGAPKGNKNRLRHGRYSADRQLREALSTLTPPQRQALLPYVREGARTIKRRQAWIDPAARHTDPKIIPFHDPRTDTTTTHAVQSKARQEDGLQPEAGPLRQLALRLAAHGFIGADAFVRVHSPAAAVIEMIADHLDSLDDRAYSTLSNPGGLIRNALHEEIAEYQGPIPHCPYCRWTSAQGKERTS